MKIVSFLFFYILVSVFKIDAQSTASKQVNTFIIDAPQLQTQKTIWVYLPKGYNDSNSSYQVIYMHDAQNLFDEKTSYVGEWKIDEYLDALETNPSIIVGIEHGNEKRIDELTPFTNEKYGGGKADAYLNFIIETLKPVVDSTYRTLSSKENTIIWGSSLGGLTSLYAVLKYPATFGKAGVFSPAIWINKDELFRFIASSNIDSNKKFYFLVGSEEGKSTDSISIMVTDQHEIVKLLKEKGVNNNHIIDRVIPEGHHNETLWSTNFPEAYQWLINND
ncbi:alpha/beta hydrolase [Geojedonia litorea]|uniref:Alpha/beta hydrolase n=1 Tax=Geojedonia litorea TaxID=1268269 RepID=A0ABV9N0D1_9FLAO